MISVAHDQVQSHCSFVIQRQFSAVDAAVSPPVCHTCTCMYVYTWRVLCRNGWSAGFFIILYTGFECPQT